MYISDLDKHSWKGRVGTGKCFDMNFSDIARVASPGEILGQVCGLLLR